MNDSAAVDDDAGHLWLLNAHANETSHSQTLTWDASDIAALAFASFLACVVCIWCTCGYSFIFRCNDANRRRREEMAQMMRIERFFVLGIVE